MNLKEKELLKSIIREFKHQMIINPFQMVQKHELKDIYEYKKNSPDYKSRAILKIIRIQIILLLFL